MNLKICFLTMILTLASYAGATECVAHCYLMQSGVMVDVKADLHGFHTPSGLTLIVRDFGEARAADGRGLIKACRQLEYAYLHDKSISWFGRLKRVMEQSGNQFDRFEYKTGFAETIGEADSQFMTGFKPPVCN